MKPNNTILIELTSNEALVFYDWLAKLNENEKISISVDSAEERVLFDIESSLEEKLTAILHEDYAYLLDVARKNVLGK